MAQPLLGRVGFSNPFNRQLHITNVVDVIGYDTAVLPWHVEGGSSNFGSVCHAFLHINVLGTQIRCYGP